ncbi:hypothetical protein, partial [Klebsiella pneumoniae]|uniref:hypothetical protein n=1 Tax=Klebsiella pneumoniae TaxID=573 RepID=UPI001954FC36
DARLLGRACGAQGRVDRRGADIGRAARAGRRRDILGGNRCRITLTSTPLFEFYRASPQNCRAPSLARINA